MSKKNLILMSAIAAMLLTACGRSGPTQTAAPITLDEGPSVSRPALTETDEVIDEPTPAPTRKPVATPTPAPTATPTAEPTAEPTAAPTAEPTATPTPTPTATPTPGPVNAYVKAIGKGSLIAAQGLAVDAGKLYVVDNARTGLLGKYAAIRIYDVESGSYTKKSIENLGWNGAKNLPTSVTRLKLDGEQLIAGDATNSYVFSLEGALIKTEATALPLPTSAVDPVSGDTFRLAGNSVERVHEGSVISTFGDDVIGTAASLAFDADGNLFVSDKTKAVVHQFAKSSK